MRRPLRILAVHQGAELYGSDRSFLQCVKGLRTEFPDAQIVVRLGGDGALRQMLAPVATEIIVAPMAIARRSDSWFLRICALGRAIRHALQIHRETARYDIVYINTIVMLDFLLAKVLWRHPGAIVHVREIPGAGFADRVLKWLVLASGAALIFNSHATRHVFAPPPSRLAGVIHNGVGPAQPGFAKPGHKTFNVLMAGRLLGWKGQDLLLEALGLWDKQMLASVEIRIVGSSFGTDEAEVERLKALAVRHELDGRVWFFGFAETMDDHYRWADVVVMPSRRPEPFGRIAIEAMAHGCALVAADHGGLPEIVLDQKTGLLFEPNSPQKLAAALARLRMAPALCAEMGRAGQERQQAMFSEIAMQNKLANFVRAVLDAS